MNEKAREWWCNLLETLGLNPRLVSESGLSLDPETGTLRYRQLVTEDGTPETVRIVGDGWDRRPAEEEHVLTDDRLKGLVPLR